MRVLLLSADGFEDLELFYPYYRIQEAGLEVDLATDQARTIKGKHGYQCPANLALADVDPGLYDALVIPGGRAPQALRTNQAVIDLTRAFYQQEKLIAAICHGPQVLISAGLAAGRKMTAYRSVQAELRQAGAIVVDQQVVIDGRLVTSRQPSDLPAFGGALIQQLFAADEQEG
ncbi:type 1 glutamine amidotransferase domain-containing protein [Moorella sp. Hama-1]|uniref:type 1 glutamine amidotransferase domain-containing protein n=1 Tax=Moorella sp. Hama-1 TaxID=2138101 RepID=UPI000D65126F|nr:type 1 glutamine amidotransferase domain-containing protein [Moorella sp. Hama-1]BCV22054.1 glutamine amidotransferase [Moorella sp. Hama-1]